MPSGPRPRRLGHDRVRRGARPATASGSPPAPCRASTGPFRGPRGRLVTGGVEHTATLGKGGSGSPIVDDQGRLLGITTLRLGDGFAVARPADADLRSRIGQLASGEEPRRRVLGVGIAPAHVARRMRRAVGLPERAGVLVQGVEEGSPAARADLRRGDLITAADGRDVADADDLFAALAGVAEGATLVLHVVRLTDEFDVTVDFTPADRPDDTPDDSPSDAPEGDRHRAHDGAGGAAPRRTEGVGRLRPWRWPP